MVPASVTEKIGQKRGLGDDGGAGFHLAVEDAERIGSDPSPAVAAEFLFPVPAESETIASRKAGRHSAQPRELISRLRFVSPSAGKKMDQHQDQFRIGSRVIRSENLDVDLMELTIASLLRPLPAEHGTDGVELRHRFGGMEGVLQVGADHRCRRLRAEASGIPRPGRRRCTSPFRRYRSILRSRDGRGPSSRGWEYGSPGIRRCERPLGPYLQYAATCLSPGEEYP